MKPCPRCKNEKERADRSYCNECLREISRINYYKTTKFKRTNLKCFVCQKEIIGGGKKYCSKECQFKGQIKMFKTECSGCGKEILKRACVKSKYKKFYCSRSCRKLNRERTCSSCGKIFLYKGSGTQTSHYCSRICRYKPRGWSRKYEKCIDCGTSTKKYGANGRCTTCQKRYLLEINPVAKEKKKKYMRNYFKTEHGRFVSRAAKEKRKRWMGKVTDIDAKFLEELWKSTDICYLCGKPMENNTTYPWGRHLEHKKPLSVKGPHLRFNVLYSHAICNLKKHTKIS